MGRPGYLSIYADDRTQKIFDEFTKIKQISKTSALTEMLEIYMLSQDEDLYLQLRKKSLNIEYAKSLILQREDTTPLNDYIFMKLGTSYSTAGKELNGEETLQAYANTIRKLGYAWFSTSSPHTGMNKKKVDYYNNAIRSGEEVKILFAIGMNINDVRYSASILEIVSDRNEIPCPGDTAAIPAEYGASETGKTWIKISNLQTENRIKADMLKFRKDGGNVKTAITNSQCHFGYVYIG